MKFVAGVVQAVWLWFLPATLASAVVALLVLIPGGPYPSFVWVLLSPFLYTWWLICFLLFCGPGIRVMGRRHPKPRRVVFPGRVDPGLITVMACSFRLHLITSLPLVAFLLQLPWGRGLVMRAYSPSVHIGKGAQIVGRLTDPDLTEVGESAVIGVGATISAHIQMVLPSGRREYITAPVKVGSFATVGGGATVTCGCTIGEYAVILPHSYLAPYTEVPPGEVWGGSPASFQKRRTRMREAVTVPAEESTA
jgi:hypothetical protein